MRKSNVWIFEAYQDNKKICVKYIKKFHALKSLMSRHEALYKTNNSYKSEYRQVKRVIKNLKMY